MVIVIIMTMIVVNIHEVKAKLSEYLDAVGRGERVLICKRNQPVAELRPVASARTEPRPFGGDKDWFEVPASFFEPLPEDIVNAFYGDVPPEASGATAAEPPAAYTARRPSRKTRR